MGGHSGPERTVSRQRIDLLKKLRGASTGGRASSIPRRPDGAVVPATALQQGLWFIDRMAGTEGSSAYNLPVAMRMRGALDLASLVGGLSAIVGRHESLRTVFQEIDGAPIQLVRPATELDVPVTDLATVPEQAREAELAVAMRGAARSPFDLAAGPLFRAQIFRLADDHHVLFANFHHIIADGLSMTVFFDELSQLYRSAGPAGAASLPALAAQYPDFAVWQQERLRGEDYHRHLGYWKRQLAGAPARLELPTDLPRPSVQRYDGDQCRFRLGADLSGRLRALARAERATTFMVLLAAFQVVLARYCRQDDILVGCPIAGRTRPELESLIGMFLNTVVLRGDLSGNPSFRELLHRTREATLAAHEHQEVPFDDLVRELRPERSLGHTPFFQVMFDLVDGRAQHPDLPGLECEVYTIDGGEAKFDLVVDFDDSPTGIGGTLGYRTDLFTRSTAERLTRHFQLILDRAVADPDRRLSTVGMLDDDERRLVIEQWNPPGTGALRPGPAAACVHEVVEARAAAAPDAVAASFGQAELTYGALDRRANQLASYLRALGVGPEVPVGVCLDRSLELVVSVLAVLKAGGAFVPLDPENPVERLVFLTADSGAAVVVTRAGTVPKLGPAAGGLPAKVLCLDADAAAIAGQPADPPRVVVRPANLAYVMYTSGSTGTPKAATNSHAGIANHLAWVQDTYRLTVDDRVVLKTPLGFDDSVRELLWPLTVGARVVLAEPGSHRDPGELVRLIDQQQVTVLHVVPSLLQALVELPGAQTRCPSLRLVMTGGEALSADLQRRYFARFEAELVNHYGPSEAAVDVTRWRCRPDGADGVPIGRPGANTRIYLLDQWGEPVPVGVPGELNIAGAQVGRGYLGRPGQTALRFVPDPFGPQPGALMYRTGDLARWRGDGVLEFLGRRDEQVKLRGYRIEPAEVERAIVGFPGIREAAVVVRQDAAGDRRLVAYLVPDGEPPEQLRLRQRLTEQLPRHMVPATYVTLAALPTNQSGKLDRRALPTPSVTGTAAGHVAPRTRTELAVAAAWATVFDRPRVGVTDDFFALGGHSLLATRVVARLREQLRVELSVNALFLSPTVEQLADRIDRLERTAAAPAAIKRIDRSRYQVRRSALANHHDS